MPIFILVQIFLFFTSSAMAANTGPEATASAADLFALWAGLHQVSSGAPDPIGGYSAGCLKGAEALPIDGDSYAVMRASRLRYYGHPELLRFIRETAQAVKKEKLGTLLVGDMSRPRGGPTLSGHASHQIGLDVDLWYALPKKAPRDREKYSAIHYVGKNGKKILQKYWTKKQTALLKIAASQASVERIFVHPAIKEYLCQTESDPSWLHKLRPWWGHDDHFHVRLSCPKDAKSCVPDEAIAAGSGCDKGLQWWFTEDARKALADKTNKPREFPHLPVACEDLSRAVPSP